MDDRSYVAAILTRDGDVARVVVTEDPRSFPFHLNEDRGEQLVITDLRVIEPVGWSLVPWVINYCRAFCRTVQ